MAHTPKSIPISVLGLPDLDYEVTLTVKNKRNGAENKIWLPNVGSVNTQNMLTRGVEGLEVYFEAGMPQLMVVTVGFNASPRSGQAIQIRDGGAMAYVEEKEGEGEENGEAQSR